MMRPLYTVGAPCSEAAVSDIREILLPGLFPAAHMGEHHILRDELPHSVDIRVRHGLAVTGLGVKNGQFAWIPFDCRESFSCVLCTHKEDQRDSLKTFLGILKKLYSAAVAFPL